MPRPQKKNAGSEYYDTTDPFIDDSELALDERQFFAQTKQQGFYVSSGEVALLKDKTPKKPKSKKISFAAGLHPSLAGTRDAPIAIDADGSPPSSFSTLPFIVICISRIYRILASWDFAFSSFWRLLRVAHVLVTMSMYFVFTCHTTIALNTPLMLFETAGNYMPTR